MTTYQYRAIDTDGKSIRGVVQAPDEYSAVQKIRQSCPIITEISAVKESRNVLSMEFGGKPKVNAKILSVLCSQFAVMLRSGMPVGRCISMIAEQTEDKKLKKMLQEVAAEVEDGSSLASSLERNGKGVFPSTFIETIRAGEQSGTIENSFSKMQIYYENASKNQEKIKAAMTYPIFVVIVAIIVLIIIMAKVIPTLTSTFESLGGNLPMMTQITIAISNFFAKWWGLFVIVILAAVIGLSVYFRTDKGALVKGKLQLRMPVMGKINTANSAAQFADTMSVLLASGLTVNNAVAVTAKVMDNELFRRDVAAMQPKIEEGQPLGKCIEASAYFPDNLKQMTAIGEETGSLEDTLQTIGEYYNNEADYRTKQALAKLEPTLLIFLAFFAGFIVISVYLPMFTMYNLM